MDRKIAKSKKLLTDKMKNIGRRRAVFSVGRSGNHALLNKSEAKKINSLSRSQTRFEEIKLLDDSFQSQMDDYMIDVEKSY